MATKRFNFKFHCEKDADIIQRLADQDNMQDYIRLLIRSDILADSINLTLASSDQEQDRERARQDYYAKNCATVNFSDYECCDVTCKHFKIASNNGHYCTIEDDFDKFWRDFTNGKI